MHAQECSGRSGSRVSMRSTVHPLARAIAVVQASVNVQGGHPIMRGPRCSRLGPPTPHPPAVPGTSSNASRTPHCEPPFPVCVRACVVVVVGMGGSSGSETIHGRICASFRAPKCHWRQPWWSALPSSSPRPLPPPPPGPRQPPLCPAPLALPTLPRPAWGCSSDLLRQTQRPTPTFLPPIAVPVLPHAPFPATNTRGCRQVLPGSPSAGRPAWPCSHGTRWWGTTCPPAQTGRSGTAGR